MKQTLILTIILLLPFSLFGQDKVDKYTSFFENGVEYKTDGKDTICIVDIMPEFKGGKEKLIKYLTANIKYPETATRDKIEGKVFVNFVVAADGKIIEEKVIKGVRDDLDNEALRVIRKMPRWKHGEQKGNAIRVSYTLPISFKL